ncbi:MAG: DNA recombination protein RmuC [Fimbriimonadaceae bacterium]|nr:DNA recombination protein RmuC [Fimbriimonadaceae bacterium]QYK57188.1 MAG: DNA recombination protein RmuC [Fimbriimonadaceae bacterium]
MDIALLALVALVGLAIGAAVAWILAVPRAKRLAEAAQSELAGAKEALAAAQVRAEFAQRAETELEQKSNRIVELEAAVSDYRSELASLDSRYEEQRKNIAEQQELLTEARQQLADTFKALSSEALEGTTKAFLTQAEHLLKQYKDSAQGELADRAKAIEQMMAPLKDKLAALEENNQQLERKRAHAYGEIGQQLKALGDQQIEFSTATSKLTKALQDPGTAGAWGELVLERVLERAGLQKGTHFSIQEEQSTEEGKQRPDAVVHLPGGRKVVIDAKAPTRSHLEADQHDGPAKETLLKDHATKLFEHARALHKRDYAKRYDSPDFVIMFVPSEAAFRAACEARPTLVEDVVALNVFVATPMTLLAFLRAVAYGWSQETLAQEAKKVQAEGQKLYESLAKLAVNFQRIGTAINQAGKAYNDTVGTLEGNVLPKARKFKELGVQSNAELAVVEKVDVGVRSLTKLNQAGEDASLFESGTES